MPTAAKELHFHTKPGPNDQGAAYLEIDAASARLTGLLARIADGKPVSLDSRQTELMQKYLGHQ